MQTLSIRDRASAIATLIDPSRLTDRLIDIARGFLKRIEAARRRKMAKERSAFVGLYLRAWYALDCIPTNEQLRFARRFRRTIYPLYYTGIIMGNRLEKSTLLLVLLSEFVLFALVPFALPNHSEIPYITALFVAAFGAGIIYSTVDGMMILLSKFFYADSSLKNTFRFAGSAILGLVCVYVVYSKNFNNYTKIYQLLYLIFIDIFGFIAIVFSSVTLRFGLQIAVRAWSVSRHADSYVVQHLFRAIRRLEVAGSEWGEISVRSQVISDIAQAGTLVRHSLFRRLGGGDPASLEWRARQVDRIAAAFGEKQTWLMTPKADTREALLGWLSRSLVALLSGAWNDLELLIEDEKVNRLELRTPRARLGKVALSSVRTLAVAGLPVLLFLLALRLDLLRDMPADLQGYMKLVLFGWIVITLMFVIDPGLKEKISMIKEAISLRRSDNKKP